jgi:hypothetical protein
MNDLRNKKVGDKVYGSDGSEWTVTRRDDDVTEVFRLYVELGHHAYWTTDRGSIIGRNMPPTFFSDPVRVIPAQGECDFSGYQVGDEVYTIYGDSRPVNGRGDNSFSVDGWGNLGLDGKYRQDQAVFHAPPNLVPSNPDAFKVPAHIAERKKAVDWSQVPIDTLVEVHVKGKWKTRYFAGWKSGTPTYFCHGATSHTADELTWATVQLSKIRLANEENTK